MAQVERARAAGPAHQAFQILRVAFTIVPIVAGIDKLLEPLIGRHLLTDWSQYLAPQIAAAMEGTVGLHHHVFMNWIVGPVEIVAGILVAFLPRTGGYVAAAWLGLIAINLLIFGQYLDIALRDFGLAFGAFALARLASEYTGRGLAAG